MPGRRYSSSNEYRYGFNGKENDDEIKGDGNQQDYGMRIYDPRIGKFLSVDPLSKSYPWYTPYQFAGNKPIKYIDLDGAEEASAEERQRAVAYLQSSIKPYISKYSTSRAFVNMSPERVTAELIAATNDPSTLVKKGENVGNICGIYAFSYAFALYDPVNFVKGVAGLYITGKTDIGGLDVSAPENLKNAKSTPVVNMDSQSFPAFVFGGALRSSYNQFVNYGGTYWGATDGATMKAWLEDRLGVTVTEFDYGAEVTMDGITSKDLKTLSTHLNSGKHALIRVNYNQFSDRTNGRKTAVQGDVAGGDHWAVLRGTMTIDEEKNTVTFTAFDMNDGLKTRTYPIDYFMDMINHVLMFEKKVENKEPK